MTARLLLALTTTTILAACGSSVKLDDRPTVGIENRTGTDTTPGQVGGVNGAREQGVGNRQITEVNAGNQSTAQLPIPEQNDPLLEQRTIRFDYDSFTIREEFRPLVEAHARFLIANPDRRVVLQGNTDERGAREYNLALGQKRSEAVRRALAVLGVSDQQVEAISFGEERPAAVGGGETAYAQNRRVDIDYQ